MTRCRAAFQCAMATALFVFQALTAHADSQPMVAGDLLVFFAMGGDGNRNLNVVPLVDSTNLKVTGRVAISSHNAIHAQTAFQDHIILLLWDQVEIYSLRQPSSPKRVASYQVRSQRVATSGSPRIEQTGDRKFLILSPAGAAELTADFDGNRWSFVDIDMTPDLEQKAHTLSPEQELMIRALVSDRDSLRPRVLKETARFRYERIWQLRTKPGLIIHTEYLRKVDKAHGKTAAQLLLSEEQETID